MHPDNLKKRKLFVVRLEFKVCTSTRYFGSYIGDGRSKRNWIKDWTEKWDRNICADTKTAGKCSQEIYAAVVCDIQPEWIFLQRVTKDTGKAF